MKTFEIIIILISSGIFSALLALFYRFGRNQERQGIYFKSMDKAVTDLNTKIDKVDSKIDINEAKFNANLDAKIDKLGSDLNTKIEKVVFDLNTKIDKAVIDLNTKIDINEAKFNTKIDKLDNKIDKIASDLSAKLDAKIDPIEKNLIQMNTRMAVMESRLSDISTNVTHLMWHNQAIPPKEELKEN
jgi:outer membrane murein-binding lipoprotein Lpp